MKVTLKIAFVVTLVNALTVYRDSEISLDESYASMDYTVLDCKVDRVGYEYRGQLGVTKRHKTCRDWNELSTWIVQYPQAGLADGPYCRNPDGDLGGPWCFTIGGSWEHCRVRKCRNLF